MSLRKNVLANFLGQGWSALMGIAFLPLYIKYLGMEAYGLVGFYAVMQVCLTVLDMGMTPTLNREMARFSAGAHTSVSIVNLVRSLEILSLGIVCLIVAVIWLLSPMIALNWLRPQNLPVGEITNAIVVMGIVLALRFVEGVYRGAILGLQKQVWLNVTSALLVTARWVGAVVVLASISSTISMFFVWQGLISAVTVFVFALAVHKALPRNGMSARFSTEAIKGVWRFAGGVTTIALLTLLLTQADKILLSRLLDLDAFGRYTFAAAVAGALLNAVAPIGLAFYPKFTELVTKDDPINLIAAYRSGTQLASVLIIPAALMLVLFGQTVLTLWTGNALLAAQVAPLLGLLAIGNMFNGLMHIPFMLQLANGWASFAAKVNAVAVCILIPTILWAVPRYGVISAAWVWVALNFSYVFISLHFMHRRLLPTEKGRWYLYACILPFVAALVTGLFFRQLLPDTAGKIATLCWLVMSAVAMFIAASAMSPQIRAQLKRLLDDKLDLMRG